MRLDLTRAGIWPRRGGRDRKTWRDLKRDYVVQLLLQRTIVELDQASGRSEGTEGETRKARHGRRDTDAVYCRAGRETRKARRGRRGTEGEARKVRHGCSLLSCWTRDAEGEARKARHERRDTDAVYCRAGRETRKARRGRRDTKGETRMQFTVVLDERRGRRGAEGEARKVRHEMLNKEIESLAGLGFQDLKDSSIKTWRKDTSVET